MPSVIIDLDPPQADMPGFTGDQSDLLYFLSWAFSVRYGANHELSLASLVLRGEFRIDLRPLLTFADRAAEDPADEEALDRAWQEPGPLAACCEAVADAFASGDRRLSAVAGDYPALRDRVLDLARIAAWAAARGARLRVTYALEEQA